MEAFQYLRSTFQIGWLNAWLGTAPLVLLSLMVPLIDKRAAGRLVSLAGYTTSDKISVAVSIVLYHGMLLYTIGVPLRFSTTSFWFGLAIFLVGFGCYVSAYIAYIGTPPDQPVMKGVYRVSRNPLYFFSSLTLLGVSIAGMSWILFFLLLCYNISLHGVVLVEERQCLREYGEAYRLYKQQVPRYFLFF